MTIGVIQEMMNVVENPARSRFELRQGDKILASAYYRLHDGRLTFHHTETPEELSGQGFATLLAHGVFEDLRRSERRAALTCPFMVRFSNKHPEYADIID